MGKQKHKNLKYLLPALGVSVIIFAATVGATTDLLGQATPGQSGGDNMLPDLVVLYAGINDDGYIEAKVSNIGKSDIPENTAAHTYIYVGDPQNPDKKYTYSWGPINHDFMKVGGASGITPAKYSALNLSVSEEDAVITVCTDPNNVVKELNEKNNCLDSKGDPVGDPNGDPSNGDPNGGDQEPVDLYPNRAGFSGAHQETLTFEVCTNNSFKDSTINADIKIIQASNKSEIFKTTLAISGLNSAKGCVHAEVPISEFRSKLKFRELYVALIDVDSDKKIAETDEKNNTGSLPFEPVFLTPYNKDDICDEKDSLRLPSNTSKDYPELKTLIVM
jgi:hypothetical protein